MTTTWAMSSPLRHPWFSGPSLKRKHSPNLTRTPSPDDFDDSASSSAPCPKRRRCSTLEHGFAHLTLHNPVPTLAPTIPVVPLSPDVSQIPAISAFDLSDSIVPGDTLEPMAIDMDLIPPSTVILPGSVEEPSSPQYSDVRMKSSSWYEPEKDRIVITDLDASDSEDEQPTDDAAFTISPTLLQRLRVDRSVLLDISSSAKSDAGTDASKALVLFKPLSIPAPLEVDEDRQQMDAMDVE